MSEPAWHVCGLALWMAVWWITEAVALPVTALLPLVVLPLSNLMPLKKASANFAADAGVMPRSLVNSTSVSSATPAVFNAANEVAVAHFLAGRLSFSGIAERVSAALHEFADAPGASLDDLLRADAAARDHVNAQVGC